eukprot:jgi/Bigna1/71918/fgenesh1_pg.17_\
MVLLTMLLNLLLLPIITSTLSRPSPVVCDRGRLSCMKSHRRSLVSSHVPSSTFRLRQQTQRMRPAYIQRVLGLAKNAAKDDVGGRDGKTNSVTLMWFRRDLRLRDNMALLAAEKQSKYVVPTFIWVPSEEMESAPGDAARVWLHEALKSLNSSLIERYGSELLFVEAESSAVSCRDDDSTEGVEMSLEGEESSSSSPLAYDKTLRAIRALIHQTNASRIIFNKVYEPAMLARDELLTKALREDDGVTVEVLEGAHLMYDPKEIHQYMPAVDATNAAASTAGGTDTKKATFQGGHWGTLNPFLRATSKLPEPSRPKPHPDRLPSPPSFASISSRLRNDFGLGTDISSILPLAEEDDLEESGDRAEENKGEEKEEEEEKQKKLHLRWGGGRHSWGERMITFWKHDGTQKSNRIIMVPGVSSSVGPASENTAHERLQFFLDEKLPFYDKKQSNADVRESDARFASPVSTLSPFLRWGQISANSVYWAVKDTQSNQDRPVSKADVKSFVRRLYWRDLAYFQLMTFPHMVRDPIRTHYNNHPWPNAKNTTLLRRWQRGQTGFPMVDAAMRELWYTGWMPQSLRMLVASFLVEYLGISWKEGHAWFHETLVDQDTIQHPTGHALAFSTKICPTEDILYTTSALYYGERFPVNLYVEGEIEDRGSGRLLILRSRTR